MKPRIWKSKSKQNMWCLLRVGMQFPEYFDSWAQAMEAVCN